MSVKIRMRRMGNRNNPFYRLVVADSRERRDGRFIEILGYYNPLRDPVEFSVQEEQALAWLKKGAKMSDTVKSLFKRQGILEKFTGVSYASLQGEQERVSKKAKKKAAQAAAQQAATPAEETPAVEAPAPESEPQNAE